MENSLQSFDTFCSLYFIPLSWIAVVHLVPWAKVQWWPPTFGSSNVVVLFITRISNSNINLVKNMRHCRRCQVPDQILHFILGRLHDALFHLLCGTIRRKADLFDHHTQIYHYEKATLQCRSSMTCTLCNVLDLFPIIDIQILQDLWTGLSQFVPTCIFVCMLHTVLIRCGLGFGLNLFIRNVYAIWLILPGQSSPCLGVKLMLYTFL